MSPRVPAQAPPQSLIPDAIRSGLKTERFGQALYLFDRVESTNTTARALAENGAAEGTVILADDQTRGRGRMGRRWISPPDVNLYVSIILRPEGDPSHAGLWSLAAAVAVARAIKQTTALPARLKWPNDIRVHEKKVAGLLLESAVRKSRLQYLVLGIGLNVNLTRDLLPESLRASVSSLREALGRDLDRIELLQRLLEQLEQADHAFKTEPPQKILEAYAALSETLGRSVIVLSRDGKWSGRAAGLTLDGGLIVQRLDGRRRLFQSGEVVHLRETHAARD